jgi:alpha-beta hydrolase superfamily lysophospholipase
VTRRADGRTWAVLAAAIALAVAVPLVVSATGPAPAPPGPAAADPAAAAAATAERMRAAGTVDLPVRFRVQNRNTSPAPCTAEPAEFEVAGHLTLPAGPVRPGATTLYLHDLQAGEWYWRTDVPGYHFAEEMAARGHASVTVDRPGHGASGGLNGYFSCVGIQADIATQIVAQLRTGSYTLADGRIDSGAAPPAFGSVTVAGHGSGAQIAELAAMTGAPDGLVLLGWADAGRTERFMTRAFANLSSCMQQVGPDQSPTSAGGHSELELGAARFLQTNFAAGDPAVRAAAAAQRQPHACKEIASMFEGISVALRGIGGIAVPVLGVYGERDALVRGGAEHVALFTGAPDAELVTVPGSGHYLGLDDGARQVHDAVAGWLGAP